MSTQTVTAYRVVCDIAGCDERTTDEVAPEFADEVALESGWVLDEVQGRDMCPAHARTP